MNSGASMRRDRIVAATLVCVEECEKGYAAISKVSVDSVSVVELSFGVGVPFHLCRFGPKLATTTTPSSTPPVCFLPEI